MMKISYSLKDERGNAQKRLMCFNNKGIRWSWLRIYPISKSKRRKSYCGLWAGQSRESIAL